MEIIKKFESESYEITTIKVKEEIYFKGKEIAEILGYKNTKQAIIINVDDDDKNKLEKIIKNMGSTELTPKKLTYNELNTIYINESGLYSLILRSKLKEAKAFKRWVTSEVLPSLRKTGKYEIPKEEQKLKEDKMRIDNIKSALEIFKMIDCIDDSIKSITYTETKNLLNNRNLNNDKNDDLDYPITRRIKDLGYTYTESDHGTLIKVGNLLKKLYVEKHEEKPKKRNAYVRGQMREINFYTSKDFDIMDEAIERYFGEE